MEHLSLPAAPVMPHPEVDFWCSPEFQISAGSFSEYPACRGVGLEDILDGNLDDRPLAFKDSLIQEWLFFGMLSGVLDISGVEVRLEDFVRKGQFDQDVITTSRLPSLVRKWKEREQQSPPLVRSTNRAKVQEVLDEVKDIVTQLDRRAPDWIPVGPGGFIIVSLGEILQYAANSIYDITGPTTENMNWPRHPWRSNRMLRDGWCLNRVGMLKQTLSSTAMYFASALDGIGSSSDKHGTCTSKECFMFNLDSAKYESKHVEVGCCCDFLGADQATLDAVLLAGKVPLVKIGIEDLESTPHLQIVACGFDNPQPYVAFSHVWSDGRGNTTSNSLPACEIRSLCNKVLALQDEGDGCDNLFWIDTLCVPVSGDFRKVAIGRMRKTYSSAAKVLVLDSEVESSSLQVAPTESLMRISCSGWLRRLWTLQEGAFAQRLFFQFREGSKDVQHLGESCWSEPDIGLTNLAAVDALGCLTHCRRFSTIGHDQVLELVEALQWRNTSRASDEPVCLATLLDLDAELMKAGPKENRMPLFLDMMRTFPAYLMFAPGKRLTSKMHAWAPASLMPKIGFGLPSGRRLAMQSSQGLIGQYSALLFERARAALRDLSWFRIAKDSALYRLRNLGQREDEGPSWKEHGPHLIPTWATPHSQASYYPWRQSVRRV